MYSATIDLVAECQKWLRNVAYVKTDGRTDGRTDRQTDRQTDRRTDRRTGGVAISPVPGPTAPAGDNYGHAIYNM